MCIYLPAVVQACINFLFSCQCVCPVVSTEDKHKNIDNRMPQATGMKVSNLSIALRFTKVLRFSLMPYSFLC